MIDTQSGILSDINSLRELATAVYNGIIYALLGLAALLIGGGLLAMFIGGLSLFQLVSIVLLIVLLAYASNKLESDEADE